MGLDDLLAKKTIKKTKKQTQKKLDKIPLDVKDYIRLYLSVESVDLLYDIVYTKNLTQKYTYDNAINEALKLLAKTMKVKLAPEHTKEQKLTFIKRWEKKQNEL